MIAKARLPVTQSGLLVMQMRKMYYIDREGYYIENL